MFKSLTDRLGGIFDKLNKQATLSEDDVNAVLREIRVALLEADVALPVAKDFINSIRDRAVGQEVTKSVTPGQQVVKIVHDGLVDMLGGEEAADLNLSHTPPIVIMMVGLQGSGKTTTTGKIGKFLTEKSRKKVLMASLDVQRPAAQEQLRQIGEQVSVTSLDIVAGQSPTKIADRALDTARKEAYDVVILDTAGRLSIDKELMDELKAVKKATKPHEIMLIADAMTGQDAVTTAQNFHEALELTGITLTRVDGDARGGAALSMKSITNVPIKLMGVGEKLDALETFHASRIADRILGMGDVVTLVEKATETIEEEDAKRMEEQFRKGEFTLEDYSRQLNQMKKMGGMSGILDMLPGMGGLKEKLSGAAVDENVFKHQQAIISSMTQKERVKPKLLNASRRRRIADGSGMSVQDVNRLLKQHQQMEKMMKQVKKLGKKGLMRQMSSMMSGQGGGMLQ